MYIKEQRYKRKLSNYNGYFDVSLLARASFYEGLLNFTAGLT